MMDMVVILLLHIQQIAQPLRLVGRMHSNRQPCIVTSNNCEHIWRYVDAYVRVGYGVVVPPEVEGNDDAT